MKSNRRGFRFLSVFILSLFIILISGCRNDEEEKEAKIAKHRAQAEQYMTNGAFKEAVIELKNLVQLSPADDRAFYELGEAYMNMGQLKDAFEYYLKAFAVNRGNLKAILKLGRLYLVANKTKDARAAVTMLLDEAPENIEVLALLADVQMQERNFDESLKTLKKAASNYPNHSGVQLTMARLQLIRGDLDQADDAYRKAASLDSTLNTYLRSSGDKYQSLPVQARYYEQSKQWDKAEKIYRELAEASSEKNTSSLMDLAAYYDRRRSYEKTLAVLEQVSALQKNDYRIQMKIANLHFSYNKIAEAETLVDEILKDYQWDRDANILKGRLLLQQRDYGGALQRFDRVVKDSPNNASLHYYRGICLMRRGDTVEAQNTLIEAIGLNPKLIDARLILAKSYLKKSKSRNEGLAQQQVDQALKLAPNHPEALTIKGMLKIQKDDMKGAEEVFKEVLQKSPNYAPAHLRLGIIYGMTGRRKSAMASYNKALEINPYEIDALVNIVKSYVKGKSFANALSICKAHIQMVKDVPTAAARVDDLSGKIYAAKGEMEKAKQHFVKAIENDPYLMSSHLALTDIYYKEENVGQVITHYENTLNENPKFLPGYMILGSIYERQDQPEKAEIIYRKVLEIEKDFAPAANNLAFNLAERGVNIEEALQLAEQAKEKRPDDPFVLDTLGWICYLLGHHGQAIAHLEKSVSLMPDNPSFNYHLGKAYYKSKQHDKARAHLSKVLELAPKSKDAADARRIFKEYRSLEG